LNIDCLKNENVFQIMRGKNEGGIESGIVAGLAKTN
jgi:hypothetical protein